MAESSERSLPRFDGPWQRANGGVWCLAIKVDGGVDVYEVEYRRPEAGAPSGYYLFGPRRIPTLPFEQATVRFDGLRLVSQMARMARYEAFARVMETVAVPDPYEHISGHDWLNESYRGGAAK